MRRAAAASTDSHRRSETTASPSPRRRSVVSDGSDTAPNRNRSSSFVSEEEEPALLPLGDPPEVREVSWHRMPLLPVHLLVLVSQRLEYDLAVASGFLRSLPQRGHVLTCFVAEDRDAPCSVGIVAGHVAAVVHSTGAEVIRSACAAWSVQLIISTGLAYGLHPQMQRIGDLLVGHAAAPGVLASHHVTKTVSDVLDKLISQRLSLLGAAMRQVCPPSLRDQRIMQGYVACSRPGIWDDAVPGAPLLGGELVSTGLCDLLAGLVPPFVLMARAVAAVPAQPVDLALSASATRAALAAVAALLTGVPLPALPARMTRHNLPPRSALLEGREDVLQRLASTVDAASAGSVVLRGVCGAGKSALLREYAYRNLHEDVFDFVIWIDGSSADATDASLLQAVQLLGLDMDMVPRDAAHGPATAGASTPHSVGTNSTTATSNALSADEEAMLAPRHADSTASRCAALLRHWLLDTSATSHQRALIICDGNVPFEPAVCPFLPDTLPRHHRVIMTSREMHSSLGPSDIGFNLPSLVSQPCVHVLVAEAGHNTDLTHERGSAYSIVKELGYHPLAIRQVASMVRRRGISLTQCLTDLHTSLKRVLDTAADVPSDYPCTVVQMVRLAVDAMPQVNSLLTVAFCALGIPRSAFEGLSWPDIYRAGFVELSDGGSHESNYERLVYMHPLLRELVLRDIPLADADGNAVLERLLRSVCTSMNDFNSHSVSTWRPALLLHRHIETICEQAIRRNVALHRVHVLLGHLSKFYEHVRCQYQKALYWTERRVTVVEMRWGKEHRRYSSVLGDHASILNRIGRSRDALVLVEEAVAVAARVSGPASTDYASRMATKAGILKHLNRYGDAEKAYRIALDIKKQELGTTNGSYGSALFSLAGLLRSMGRYQEALTAFETVQGIYTKRYGAVHPWVGACYTELAHTHEKMNQLVRAKELYETAQKIILQAVGSNHMRYADTSLMYAMLLIRMSETQQALPILEDAKKVYVRALGSSHTKVRKVTRLLTKYQNNRQTPPA